MVYSVWLFNSLYYQWYKGTGFSTLQTSGIKGLVFELSKSSGINRLAFKLSVTSGRKGLAFQLYITSGIKGLAFQLSISRLTWSIQQIESSTYSLAVSQNVLAECGSTSLATKDLLHLLILVRVWAWQCRLTIQSYRKRKNEPVNNVILGR